MATMATSGLGLHERGVKGGAEKPHLCPLLQPELGSLVSKPGPALCVI
jgi:hypothetical protein